MPDTEHTKAALIAYLEKVPDDEPLFLLRAQDQSAPSLIIGWKIANPQVGPERLERANRCIMAMRAWPRRKRAD